MKLFHIEVEVKGFYDLLVKAETEGEARDMVADRFNMNQPISKLNGKSLDIVVLDVEDAP